jgi:predicted O-methyltransferase YrrM
MNQAKTMLREFIRGRGFDVVRVTVGASVRARAGEPADSGEFFPVEPNPKRFKPWPVPPDLAARGEEWAKVLCRLYTRPASWPACVSPETGMLIHAFVRNIRPRVVVETGTCHGASALWMAAAMRLGAGEGADAGVIHTFDDFLPPCEEWRAKLPLNKGREAQVRGRFTRCGFDDMIRVHVGDSATNVAAARDELRDAGGVQLAFIDADHTPMGVQRDFEAVEPVLNIGGYILLHDVFPTVCRWTGPRWLADNIHTIAVGRYQLCDLYTSPLNYGLTVLRRVG